MSGQRRWLTKSTLVVVGLVAIAGVVAMQFGRIPGLTALFKGAVGGPVVPVGGGSPIPASTAIPESTLAQQQQLIQQEADLQSREAALKEQETKVAEMFNDLNLQKADGDSMRRVAAMYAAMPPYKAAPIIEALTEAEAVIILRLLDQEQAGAILASMDPALGSQLTSELMKPQDEESEP